jgi:hypothetical protein
MNSISRPARHLAMTNLEFQPQDHAPQDFSPTRPRAEPTPSTIRTSTCTARHTAGHPSSYCACTALVHGTRYTERRATRISRHLRCPPAADAKVQLGYVDYPLKICSHYHKSAASLLWGQGIHARQSAWRTAGRWRGGREGGDLGILLGRGPGYSCPSVVVLLLYPITNLPYYCTRAIHRPRRRRPRACEASMPHDLHDHSVLSHTIENQKSNFVMQ